MGPLDRYTLEADTANFSMKELPQPGRRGGVENEADGHALAPPLERRLEHAHWGRGGEGGECVWW
jgi:hypothetical protein